MRGRASFRLAFFDGAYGAEVAGEPEQHDGYEDAGGDLRSDLQHHGNSALMPPPRSAQPAE